MLDVNLQGCSWTLFSLQEFNTSQNGVIKIFFYFGGGFCMKGTVDGWKIYKLQKQPEVE